MNRPDVGTRARRAASFGALVVTILTLGTMVGAQQRLYPDIVSAAPDAILPVQEIEWPQDSGNRLLTVHFTGYVHNIGDGPLVIRGNPQLADPADPAAPHQWVETSTGSEVREHPVTIYFATEDNHFHWHLDRAMEYSLWNESKTRQVTPGAKVGFCMLDSQTAPDNPDGVVAGASRFRFVEGENCAHGEDTASSVEMGVSVGYRDVYGYDLEFQWIDVSDVAPGRYWVATQSDPGDVIAEKTERNNGTVFSADSVIVPGYSPSRVATPATGVTRITLPAEEFTDPDAADADGIDTYFAARPPSAFADLGPKRFEITTQPRFGSATVDAETGEATYTPDAGYTGPDGFRYTVYDTTADYPRTKPSAWVDINGGLAALPAPDFNDVPETHTFVDDIAWMAAREITKGCAEQLYCPDDLVSRGQLASFLVRALRLPAPTTDTDTFTDDAGSVHEEDIEALAASGITKGCSDSGFCPNDPVTRAQLASFLVRALDGVDPITGVNTFTDDQGSVHEGDIEGLAASGITKGCAPDRFCPTDPLTRAQLAAFLHRALG